MSIPGPSKFRKRPDFRKEIKALAFISGHNIMPDVKLYKPRKPRAHETGPRSQPERQLRAEVIKYLRRKGCYVKRIENSICNELGNFLPDIVFFTPAIEYNCYPRSRMFFAELKSLKGTLSQGQKKFRECCELAGIGYLEVRSLEDIKERVG